MTTGSAPSERVWLCLTRCVTISKQKTKPKARKGRVMHKVTASAHESGKRGFPRECSHTLQSAIPAWEQGGPSVTYDPGGPPAKSNAAKRPSISGTIKSNQNLSPSKLAIRREWLRCATFPFIFTGRGRVPLEFLVISIRNCARPPRSISIKKTHHTEESTGWALTRWQGLLPARHRANA